MTTKMQQWGNSQGLRFPKAMLKELGINVGDEVKMSIQDKKVIIEAVKPQRGKYRLKDLVARMPKDYRAAEVEWGKPVGKEEW